MVRKVVDLIVGTRPNLVKAAAIWHAFMEQQANCTFTIRFVHTGQHYDEALSGSFVRQLELPKIDHNFSVGSGTHSEQVGNIMICYEKLLSEKKSDLCVVVGDVNSTLACAITAKKLGIPVAHVEAGIRSWDWSMPEEVNRVATDAVSDLYFTTSAYANENLRMAGVDDARIKFVGNTMIDTLMRFKSMFKRPEGSDTVSLGQYALLTLHRPSNVDDTEMLLKKLKVISSIHENIIFPVHPRTLARLKSLPTNLTNITYIDPQPYFEFMGLLQNCDFIVTDSGGISEEALIFNKRCLTLRDNTERPETVDAGSNHLVGSDTDRLKENLETALATNKCDMTPILKWDGMAGQRIISSINSFLK